MRKVISMMVLLCLLLSLGVAQAGGVGAADNEWTVTLSYQDGQSRPGTLYVEKGSSVTLPTTAVREGYTFAAWLDGNGQVVDATAYQPEADVTLTAQWDIGQSTVTLVDSDNATVLEQVSLPYGAQLPELAVPAKDGFAFRYWSLSANGERMDTAAYSVEGDMNLYAVWMEEGAKEFKVTFKASEFASEHSADVVLYKGEGVQVKKSEVLKDLTREGYKFDGWTTEKPKEGNEWTINDFPAKKKPKAVKVPFKPKEDTDLYAVWTIEQYMAIFNANYTDSPYQNGVVDSFRLVATDSVVPPTEDPVREGYTFAGWYTNALSGEKVDFSQEIHLKVNTGYYAHWVNNGVNTDTFHAEYTAFDPTQPYYGYSGSVLGANCIVKDAGMVGTVLVDEYPVNSKLTGGNGYYVSYQYERGNTLRFVINSSKATTAKLIANLAVEVDAMDVASTGDNATAIRINGKDLTYSVNLIRLFREYELGTVELNEGENVIEFVVDNDNTVMGGTYRAVGFMTDYIKLTDTDATLSWAPIYDNLEMN